MASMPVLAIGSDRAWRARLERILHGHTEMTWLGSRGPGETRSTSQSSPALLLLDGDDPRVERELHSSHQPLPPRVYFYRHAVVENLRQCAHSGANGCLEKTASAEAVLRALRAVGAGLFAVETDLLMRTLAATMGEVVEPAPRQETHGDFSLLTERQREIVRHAAQGLSNKQIARQLGISPETVKTHLHHVFERAGISGRVALLAAQWADNETIADSEGMNPTQNLPPMRMAAGGNAT